MLDKIILNRTLAKTIVGIGIVGLSYYAGYQTKSKYSKPITIVKEKIITELRDRIPEKIIKPDMQYYRHEILSHPQKYRQDIIDITAFGIKTYPTDLFMKGVKGSVGYIHEGFEFFNNGKAQGDAK